jgi:hypothetical protein|tara:strand:+ start:155 stop:484 length:330 start_codon:yes stop_codon:yes gene_type:complete
MRTIKSPFEIEFQTGGEYFAIWGQHEVSLKLELVPEVGYMHLPDESRLHIEEMHLLCEVDEDGRSRRLSAEEVTEWAAKVHSTSPTGEVISNHVALLNEIIDDEVSRYG